MTAREGRVLAQAKVNLALRVLAREASGYHQLETLFARLELGDVVTVRVGGTGRTLQCDGPAASASLGPAERNLAWRAAAAFAAETGFPDGFSIDIEKHIPIGGGLGGGSADAGAVLRVLNALAPTPLPQARLLAVAGALGADVPFLTTEAPLALAWGRGDRMVMLPPLASRDVALVHPPFGIATADAFGWLAAERGAGAPGAAAIDADALRSWAGVTALAGNDFEGVVAQRYPVVGDIAGTLRAAGARIAQLSGSGSTVFGVFDALPDRAGLDASLPVPAVHTRTAMRVVAVEVME